MSGFFGFIPSNDLLKNIQEAQAKRNSKEPLYLLRDKIAMQMNDEILDHVLIDLIHHFPASEKKVTAEKLVGYIKSTVHVLLKQLLNKSSNEQVQASLDFIERSLFKDSQGQLRVGAPLDQSFSAQLKSSYTALLDGAKAKDMRPILVEQYKQFADQLIHHFMIEFNRTLDLGMIKRKAADIGASAVTKAVHIGVDKLIPHLTSQELLILAKEHDDLIHQN
ncbi:hypothetical protein F4V57_04410 [Acinetobacter qingfengensis]|uniref:EsvE2 protein n=1 Tax=Acinetobacter qingfengensis TaxID=1262585 RepID=A0A1E7RES3_9GAMM|nr:hypothetical protein [Acinetobacter qingfengensis]KAA8735005.1 hypothetical protein F4V57_04410 [Acinetobacter qingfengensis]OEY97727.1 hypothetical protein BJI46_08205 [Acinetobacter qingfengensis]